VERIQLTAMGRVAPFALVALALFASLHCNDHDGGGPSSAECTAKYATIAEAVAAATACDASAASPCATYNDGGCTSIGVSAAKADELAAAFSAYEALGCSRPDTTCPIFEHYPPPYDCRADQFGVDRCLPVCESIMAGASCVATDAGCSTLTLNGYCDEPSTICCSP